MIGKLFRRANKSEASVGHYDLTYAGCADFLIDRMFAEEPPFDHNEWYFALIRVDLPSGELDAIESGLYNAFKSCCWMNSMAIFVSLIFESRGEESGHLLIRAIEEQLITRLPDAGPSLAVLFRAELAAPPLPSDHPVFAQKGCESFSKHTAAFGRAKAALDYAPEIGNISKMEVLSLLGRCVTYGTICSSERFSAVVPRIRFVEKHSKHTQTT